MDALYFVIGIPLIGLYAGAIAIIANKIQERLRPNLEILVTRTGPSDFPHDLPYHAGSATVVVHQDGVLV